MQANLNKIKSFTAELETRFNALGYESSMSLSGKTKTILYVKCYPEYDRAAIFKLIKWN